MTGAALAQANELLELLTSCLCVVDTEFGGLETVGKNRSETKR